eukprot:scaffold3277_cov218-Pinguiococcus_pyrenoidosus.AAC.4
MYSRRLATAVGLEIRSHFVPEVADNRFVMAIVEKKPKLHHLPSVLDKAVENRHRPPEDEPPLPSLRTDAASSRSERDSMSRRDAHARQACSNFGCLCLFSACVSASCSASSCLSRLSLRQGHASFKILLPGHERHDILHNGSAREETRMAHIFVDLRKRWRHSLGFGDRGESCAPQSTMPTFTLLPSHPRHICKLSSGTVPSPGPNRTSGFAFATSSSW